MKQLLTRNLGWKILSLCIALALWIAVARETELATSLPIPVRFKNMPDDLDISSTLPDRVQLEVRGPSGRLSSDNLANVALIIDLSDARVGERTYAIHASNITLPVGVDFHQAVPAQLTLRFDRVTSRQVSIIPRFVNQPDGYRLSGYVMDPSKTKIRGPQDRVQRIEQVLTDPIDLAGVVSAAEFRTHVNVGDPQLRLEVPTVVTVRVKLEKTIQKEVK